MDIINQLKKIPAGQFVSFTYTSKAKLRAGEMPETARYTIILGFSYTKILETSQTDLTAKINAGEFGGVELEAAREVLASIEKSLAALAEGKQSEDYTKRGMYIPLGNGLSVNGNDGTLQVFGLQIAKKVIVPGKRIPVNSSPLVAAKNNIKYLLPLGKFREFALDVGAIHTIKANGQEVHFLTAYDLANSVANSVADTVKPLAETELATA